MWPCIILYLISSTRSALQFASHAIILQFTATIYYCTFQNLICHTNTIHYIHFSSFFHIFPLHSRNPHTLHSVSTRPEPGKRRMPRHGPRSASQLGQGPRCSEKIGSGLKKIGCEMILMWETWCVANKKLDSVWARTEATEDLPTRLIFDVWSVQLRHLTFDSFVVEVGRCMC